MDSTIQYLIMDVDGSLTDGKIYMGPYGEAIKAFSIKDGYAINNILKLHNIIPIILTARTSSIVQTRCEELGINAVYQGKIDKLSALKENIGESNFGVCAYFGDDIIDLQCMTSIKDVSGQFRASNSIHSSRDVCPCCFSPVVFLIFYRVKAGRYSL